jgi:hypothetical protein
VIARESPTSVRDSACHQQGQPESSYRDRASRVGHVHRAEVPPAPLRR